MTSDASRRLKLAKKAAAAVLMAGGDSVAAAKAAQAFGTPCDGSDDSSVSSADEEELPAPELAGDSIDGLSSFCTKLVLVDGSTAHACTTELVSCPSRSQGNPRQLHTASGCVE
eukprot:CAMPEP_0181238128 /NCGR_PEP_ID=MMETSP1096-20121128/39166_1 /TAXON_ID=156174 ORGANISM="Chrysochromulina ericina, Strain CCMP281" /NCGR_SAMPLE_ID=MMETSP1096 /ASSEMBLY_ACC=CAM_ASM_000453 /LENGTH=113 /DNA_ID=CAMNT_0023333599 /DNA_START=155 /DNA_END=496 /DNA_ORIENTATION=+